MDQKMKERNKCLLLWVASLPTFSTGKITPTVDHFKDGVMTSRILKNVIDPEYFGDLSDSPKESMDLFKVVEKMKKYLAKQTGHPAASYLVPQTGKIIASDDIQEINRLLQFILNCAVNSQCKENFITDIMQMEDAVQFDLMNAIKEMLQIMEKPDVDLEPDIPSHSEVATLNEIIQQLSQQNHEFKSKLSEMAEEKVALLNENVRLNTQLTAHLNDPESIHISLKHQEEYKKECDRLREENHRLEAAGDDNKLRIQVLEKQLLDFQQKAAMNESFHDEALRNKDEVDSLREAAAKVPKLENVIQVYKRMLETVDVLKQDVKELEEQNSASHIKSKVAPEALLPNCPKYTNGPNISSLTEPPVPPQPVEPVGMSGYYNPLNVNTEMNSPTYGHQVSSDGQGQLSAGLSATTYGYRRMPSYSNGPNISCLTGPPVPPQPVEAVGMSGYYNPLNVNTAMDSPTYGHQVSSAGEGQSPAGLSATTNCYRRMPSYSSRPNISCLTGPLVPPQPAEPVVMSGYFNPLKVNTVMDSSPTYGHQVSSAGQGQSPAGTAATRTPSSCDGPNISGLTGPPVPPQPAEPVVMSGYYNPLNVNTVMDSSPTYGHQVASAGQGQSPAGLSATRMPRYSDGPNISGLTGPLVPPQPAEPVVMSGYYNPLNVNTAMDSSPTYGQAQHQAPSSFPSGGGGTSSYNSYNPVLERRPSLPSFPPPPVTTFPHGWNDPPPPKQHKKPVMTQGLTGDERESAENEALPVILETLRTACYNNAHQLVQKRKLEDIGRKLEIFSEKLREGSLSAETLEFLCKMVDAVRNNNCSLALSFHTQLVTSGNFSEISSFLPAIKVLIQMAAQLGVYLL